MLTSILQYSTIDYRFLQSNLEQLSKFSNEIIVPICNHLFNGELENQELLQKSIDICKQYSNVQVYMFEWQGHNDNPGYYHNLSRLLGTNIAKNEWLLFVDSDEIISDNFGKWFDSAKDTDNTYWFTCYWYFREPIYRSTKTEGAGLLIKKSKCNWNINIRQERQQLFGTPNFVNGDHTNIFYNNQPLVHHFSWVRTKEDMLKKVKNWGHKSDKNWLALVETEFTHPFDGSDFVHGYQYETVENIFNL